MKCNSCWRVLDGRAIATTCGHVFCPEDASKIITSDSSCPICEQILSKSNMKAVDLSPGDDWVNMVMAGTPPQSIMKSAYKGVMFWIGQKEVESQVTFSKAMHLKQKYDEMQNKYMEKLEQVHGAYQKAMKKIQMLEHEKENMMRDKAELQQKYTEKSKQKRKLEEMYEALRTEYEQLQMQRSGARKDNIIVKRPPQFSSYQTPRGFPEPKSHTPAPGQLEAFAPVTPSQNTDLHLKASPALGYFDGPGIPASRTRGMPAPSPSRSGFGHQILNRNPGHSPFKANDPANLFTPAGGNASAALRNLLLSPMRKRNGISGMSR